MTARQDDPEHHLTTSEVYQFKDLLVEAVGTFWLVFGG